MLRIALAIAVLGPGAWTLEDLRSRPANITGACKGEFADRAECTDDRQRSRYRREISKFPRQQVARLGSHGDTREMAFRQSSPGVVAVESREMPTLVPEKKETSPFWQAVESCSVGPA